MPRKVMKKTFPKSISMRVYRYPMPARNFDFIV